MIKNNKYSPIVKTGDAELRALSNLNNFIKASMIPLIEITRGRKSKKDTEGAVLKRINQLKLALPSHTFMMDLTSEKDLSNKEIMELYNSENGYKNWVDFCLSQKKNFQEIYPVVQMEEEENDNYDKYIANLSLEVKALSGNFKYIVFRASESSARKVIRDIKTLLDLEEFNNLEDKIIYVLDYEYICDKESGTDNAVEIINYLKDNLGVKNIVLTSTSFPSNVSNSFSKNDSSVVLNIIEYDFFHNIVGKLNNNASDKLNLIYGDYASINPKRNDGITRGWIPRIDVPVAKSGLNTYLERERRFKTKKVNDEGKTVIEYGKYAEAYEIVAKRVVLKDFYQKASQLNCWGTKEIYNASQGFVSASSPSFWISVRMNIHINVITSIFFPI